MGSHAERAPAKINLYLHVTGRRDDGYHLLDSLAVFAGAADVLTVEPADSLSLAVEGPFAAGLGDEPDNLVLRAARALAALVGIAPTGRLTLWKELPIASGIGGGSADAAAALRLLCRLWGVKPPSEALHAIATDLGADVPVCLDSTPARMSGIGERLVAAPLFPDIGLVLVNPGVAVSTPAVFRARAGGFSPPALLPADGWPDAGTLVETLGATTNDLQAPAVSLAPAIAETLTVLGSDPACRLARMSGSGATCFGVYASPDSAREAAQRFVRPEWWVWGGGLHRPARF